MGRPQQNKFVANSQIVTASATVGATAPSPFQLTNPFPVGDIVLQELNFRITAGLNLATGGGTAVTDGGLQFIRQVLLQTPQHANIVELLDGISLHDIMTVQGQVHPIHQDLTSTAAAASGASEYHLCLRFQDPDSFNIADLGLDMLRSGQPLLQLNLGVYGDFVSGGAAADVVNKYNLESSLMMDPGAVTDPDLPVDWMPFYGQLTIPISSTVAQQQIFLAFGDRIIKRLYVTQRNSSTNARLANTVIGVNETDRISVKINSNFPWVDRVEWAALQAQNARIYRLASMPTGMACVDFVRRVLGGVDATNSKGGGAGAKLSDALSVLSKNQGTLELDADVTSVSNGSLRILYEAVKVLPPGARRPAPAPATPARG